MKPMLPSILSFMKRSPGKLFMITGLLSLAAGTIIGLLGSGQYISYSFLNHFLPFVKVRPLHVSLVVAWIFAGAIASIYEYLPQVTGKPLYSSFLAKLHWVIFFITGVAILCSYTLGVFGGREYLEFPVFLAIPIGLSWILFIFNFIKSVKGFPSKWPVYLWMWATGIFFFLFTFIESYLWLIPYFQNNIIRDITVQWKSLGAMVGSWNMMVYGTAFYLMERLNGNKQMALSGFSFFFYFLGLTNLMFNWGHHTYIVPAKPWIREVAYIVSMTELLLLGYILWNWRNTLSDARKKFHLMPYRFLTLADFWIALNLALAILISVPAINRFTHGTHITVAHAMGATIGINTTILFASAWLISGCSFMEKASVAFWIFTISTFIFWLSLIGMGFQKIGRETVPHLLNIFGEKPAFFIYLFAATGAGTVASTIFLIKPLVSKLFTPTKEL